MKKNLITASLFAVAITLWLLSGIFFKAPEEPVPTVQDQGLRGAPLVRVRTRQSLAQPRMLYQSLRGKTASKRSAAVAAETAGRVVARAVERGDWVAKGDLLCELAVDDRAANVQEARANLKQVQIEYEGAKTLKAKGLVSDSRIAQLEAQQEAASAALSRQELNLARTRITSPFSGVVETLPLNEGDFAQFGSVCATVVDLDPLLVTANVSEKDIHLMTEGQAVTAQTSSGETLEGAVSFVGNQSDEATRTYPLEITVPNPDFRVRAGLTAVINVRTREVRAHRVSPALFSLNDEGVLGLRSVDENDRVVFYPVEIVEDAIDGAWVTGLPDAVELITVGQEFVAAGQLVETEPDVDDTPQGDVG